MNCVIDSRHSRHAGRHRGADDVLGAAQRDAQTASRVADANGDDPAIDDIAFADDDDLPFVVARAALAAGAGSAR